jgi:hypothetical protein
LSRSVEGRWPADDARTPKKLVDPDEQKRCDDLAKMTGPLADLQKDVLDVSCTSCHGVVGGAPGGFVLKKCGAMENAERLRDPWSTLGPLACPNDEQSPIFKLLRGEDGLPQMPAGGIRPEQTEVVLEWIRAGAPTE